MTFFIRFPEEKVEELLHNHLHPLSAGLSSPLCLTFLLFHFCMLCVSSPFSVDLALRRASWVILRGKKLKVPLLLCCFLWLFSSLSPVFLCIKYIWLLNINALNALFKVLLPLHHCIDRAFYATLRGWRSGCRLGSDGLLPSSLKFESASRCETMDCMLCTVKICFLKYF